MNVSAYANVYGLVDARRSHLYCQTFEWKHLRTGWETKEGSKQTLVLNSTSAPGVKTLKDIQSSMPPDAFLAGTGLDRLQLPDTIQKLGKAHVSALNLFTLWEMPNRSERFSRVNIGLFEPEYVTMTQTNQPVT